MQFVKNICTNNTLMRFNRQLWQWNNSMRRYQIVWVDIQCQCFKNVAFNLYLIYWLGIYILILEIGIIDRHTSCFPDYTVLETVFIQKGKYKENRMIFLIVATSACCENVSLLLYQIISVTKSTSDPLQISWISFYIIAFLFSSFKTCWTQIRLHPFHHLILLCF